MSMIIAIDGGTTNTRFSVVENGQILSCEKLSMGIRNTLTPEGRAEFISEISGVISRITEKTQGRAEAVVLSGMIGSETGLYTCEHIAAPVSQKELAAKMTRVIMPEVCELPMLFIPGIKTCTAVGCDVSLEKLSEMDIMRGEETELIGIFARLGLSDEVIFALPGSHMKYIATDAEGGIKSFRTSIAGELIRATAENTILKASLDGAFPKRPDRSALIMGYRYADAHGVTEAMFKVRILDKFADFTKDGLYSFLLGVILHEDIKALAAGDAPIYIGGSGLFREAIKLIIESEHPKKRVFEVPSELSDNAAAYGAEWLYNAYKATL